jgi:hypothetical protein
MVIDPIAPGDTSKIDGLIEVARMLKDARSIAEGCSNKALVYFMDMAIFEVCEALAALRGPDSAYAAQKTRPRSPPGP